MQTRYNEALAICIPPPEATNDNADARSRLSQPAAERQGISRPLQLLIVLALHPESFRPAPTLWWQRSGQRVTAPSALVHGIQRFAWSNDANIEAMVADALYLFKIKARNAGKNMVTK